MRSGAVVAGLPVGSDSDVLSADRPTKNDSLPATARAPPPSVQPATLDSRSPPGARVYWPLSPQGINACLRAGCGTQPCGLAAVVAAWAALVATSSASPERALGPRPVGRELGVTKGILRRHHVVGLRPRVQRGPWGHPAERAFRL